MYHPDNHLEPDKTATKMMMAKWKEEGSKGVMWFGGHQNIYRRRNFGNTVLHRPQERERGGKGKGLQG